MFVWVEKKREKRSPPSASFKSQRSSPEPGRVACQGPPTQQSHLLVTLQRPKFDGWTPVLFGEGKESGGCSRTTSTAGL